MQSLGSLNTDEALYCKECLRVDQSIHDVETSELESRFKALFLSLKAQSSSIKSSTTCPSCRDILNLYEKEASELDCFETIKSRLQTCERGHIFCQHDPDKQTTISLYLIDVVEECITFMPPPQLRYAALSYVWGNVSSTKLTSGNIEALQKPRSLSHQSHTVTIPLTIRNAMRLTADLDIRYLWVDCLCILQDDPQINLYLNQMHTIYHNAHLTIVVANKNNADGGITGYETSPSTRTLPGKVIRYPNYVLGSMAHSTHENEFPWFSRGWTLQEGFFSRRALVISDRISLKCAETTFEEGAIFTTTPRTVEAPEMIVQVLSEANTLLRSFCESSVSPRLSETGSEKQSLDFDRWKIYAKVVNEFAPRALSRDTDVIRAYSGVISYFTRPDKSWYALNTELLYGHPIHALTTSLLWTSHKPKLRRRNLPLRQDGSPTIPSWSWMAWQHGDKPDLERHFSLEEWTNSTNLDIPTVIQAQCSTCLQMHEMTMKRCSNGASQERVDPDCLHPYLYIKAQRGRFRVSRHTKKHEERGHWLVCLSRLEKKENNYVGTMTFDLDPPKWSLDILGPLYFIGICCNGYRGSSSQVKALCIKPVGNRPFVFERLGVAKIRKEEWDSIAWYDENIILG
ncbi:hypothetical protein GT037_010143 [Alternaria burnsii]|uniref:Heterokaryon incompatibility domain-containing protein n=1 Tax=Alternaria burnsii TaxID=1187904 RepID=A0A8H7AUP9_9PLEO|nr:uncharacterized protein GT037_010143 [Alternaria burnsii]KAF7671920.1 hypothetical protein GT037_010143 [Alternaria burnsii]